MNLTHDLIGCPDDQDLAELLDRQPAAIESLLRDVLGADEAVAATNARCEIGSATAQRPVWFILRRSILRFRRSSCYTASRTAIWQTSAAAEIGFGWTIWS